MSVVAGTLSNIKNHIGNAVTGSTPSINFGTAQQAPATASNVNTAFQGGMQGINMAKQLGGQALDGITGSGLFNSSPSLALRGMEMNRFNRFNNPTTNGFNSIANQEIQNNPNDGSTSLASLGQSSSQPMNGYGFNRGAFSPIGGFNNETYTTDRYLYE